jgi:hypothetical protein
MKINKISKFNIMFKSVSKFKIMDQIVSASNSYALLLVPLINQDFKLLGQISTILSLYVFWIGLIRITLVNEMLRSNYTKHQYLGNLRSALIISSFSAPLFFLGFIFHLSSTSMILAVLFIIIGVQEELLRQHFLAIKSYLYAFIVDSTWFVITLLGSSWCYTRNLTSVNYLLTINLIGCAFAVTLGNILIFGPGRQRIPRNVYSKLDARSVWLPIFATLHTIFLNISLISINQEVNLGILRAGQLFFLPAIFIINIQQNYFLSKVKLGIRSESFLVFRSEYFRIFMFFGLLSFTLSLFYFYKLHIGVNGVLVPLILLLSTVIAFYSNLEIITLAGTKFLRNLIFLRFAWLSSASISMLMFKSNFVAMLFVLLIIDFLFVLCVQQVSNRMKLKLQHNL